MEQLDNNCGVYQILNIVTGKSYIGSSGNLEKRKRAHFNALVSGYHANVHLQRSFDKNGIDAFLFIPFHLCSPDERLGYELFWIDALGAVKRGYNLTRCVSPGMYGKKHNNKTRQKMSIAHKGKKYPRMSEAARNRPHPKTGHRADRISFRCMVCGTWKEMMYSRYKAGGESKYCSLSCYRSVPVTVETRDKLSAAATKQWADGRGGKK